MLVSTAKQATSTLSVSRLQPKPLWTLLKNSALPGTDHQDALGLAICLSLS